MDNPFTKYLEDVPWDNSLRLSNGKTVHGLEQLPMVIKYSDDEVFYSHVNDQKNDFANWIRDVIGYPQLAEKLLSVKKKEDFLTFMDKAIIDIKNDMKNYKPPEPKPEPVPIQVSATISPTVSPSYSTTAIPVTSASISIAQSITPPNPQSIAQSVVVPTVAPAAMSAATSMQQDAKPVSPALHSINPVVSESQLFDGPSHDAPNPAVVSISAPVVSTLIAEAVVPEETFDFEEIFKVLLAELEQEALTWDTQTS